MVLSRESYSLLMGETASPEVLRDVVALVVDDPNIKRVEDPLSMFLGPEEIVLVLYAEFPDNVSIEHISTTIKRTRQRIKEKYPYFKRIFIQPLVQ